MKGQAVLWAKAILALVGLVFVGAIQMTEPANLLTLTGDAASVYDDGAKAASFALVAAMMLAIERMPTGKSGLSKFVGLSALAVMAAAGFLAAWYWLKDETGNPSLIWKKYS